MHIIEQVDIPRFEAEVKVSPNQRQLVRNAIFDTPMAKCIADNNGIVRFQVAGHANLDALQEKFDAIITPQTHQTLEINTP